MSMMEARRTARQGERYFLDDRPVHNGYMVEIHLAGRWIRMRIEGLPQSPRAFLSITVFEDGARFLGELDAALPLNADLRWPPTAEPVDVLSGGDEDELAGTPRTAPPRRATPRPSPVVGAVFPQPKGIGIDCGGCRHAACPGHCSQCPTCDAETARRVGGAA